MPELLRRLAVLILAAGAAAFSSGCARPSDYQRSFAEIRADSEISHSAGQGLAMVDGANGQVFPKTLPLRVNTHIAVWLTNGDSLKITFQDPSIKARCTGRRCVAGPFAKEGIYEYGGEVTLGGKTSQLDPRLEVVP